MGCEEKLDDLIGKLPIKRDDDDEKEKRKDMFKEFDINGNKYLSYSDVGI